MNEGEAAFLAAYDPGEFAHPSVSVDVVLIGIVRGTLRVLLIRRTEHPHLDAFGLPGGFVGIDETLDAAAERVLTVKAGLSDLYLEQLYTFGAVERDPRTRVITVAYYALVDGVRLECAGGLDGAVLATIAPGDSEGSEIDVLDGERAPVALAFNHVEIVRVAVRRIRGKLDYAPIGYELLPETFTLLDLQRVHEIVAGRAFNKDSFRRKMLASGAIAPTGESQMDVGHRPAALYRYVDANG